MNEDTEMVVKVLENDEVFYLEIQRLKELSKRRKSRQGFGNRITGLLRQNRPYLKEQSGGADMRKVIHRQVADYFWSDDENQTPA